MLCVVALYDEDERCVYVGAFDDAALAVAALCRKHGRHVVGALRYEDFSGAAKANDAAEELEMMQGFLVKGWLDQATEENGGAAPVGNADEAWAEFDSTANPFLAGILGPDGSTAPGYDLLTDEELAAEKLQRRPARGPSVGSSRGGAARPWTFRGDGSRRRRRRDVDNLRGTSRGAAAAGELDIPRGVSHGAAAAARWIFCWGRVAPPPRPVSWTFRGRRGHVAGETSRDAAAAAT